MFAGVPCLFVTNLVKDTQGIVQGQKDMYKNIAAP